MRRVLDGALRHRFPQLLACLRLPILQREADELPHMHQTWVCGQSIPCLIQHVTDDGTKPAEIPYLWYLWNSSSSHSKDNVLSVPLSCDMCGMPNADSQTLQTCHHYLKHMHQLSIPKTFHRELLASNIHMTRPDCRCCFLRLLIR